MGCPVFSNKNKITHNLLRCEIVQDHLGPRGYIYCVKAETKFGEEYFMLDTGASVTIFHRIYVATEFCITPQIEVGEVNWIIHGGKMTVDRFRHIFWTLDREFLCADLSHLRKIIGIPIAAIIGTDVLQPLNAEINLHKLTLTLRPE